MVPETLTFPGAVELAVIDRGGFIESRHAGAAIVLSPEGDVAARYGDTSALILPRSTLKPLQAAASILAGATPEGVQLALSTASHMGTPRHIEVVDGMLAAAGLGRDALECPESWPSGAAARDDLIREGSSAARVYMNCSGKHAAMLQACVAQGWETRGYLDAEHPLQRHIREVVERLTGERIAASVTDGCGAPVHAVSLAGLARGLHRLLTASESSPFALHRAGGRLARAVRENPWAIAGEEKPDTVAIEELGVFSKSGAEAIVGMVAADGTTVVVKTLDGNNRAGVAVASELLVRAGAVSDDARQRVTKRLPLTVLGGGHSVGTIRVTVPPAQQ